MRKEQGSPRVKDKVKFTDKKKWMLQSIFKEVQEKKKVKPRKDLFLSSVCSLQQRVNNLKEASICKIQSKTKEYFWISAN